MLWWWTIAMLGLYALVAQTCSSATFVSFYMHRLLSLALPWIVKDGYTIATTCSLPFLVVYLTQCGCEALWIDGSGKLWASVSSLLSAAVMLLCDDVVVLELSKKYFALCVTNLGNANLEWPWEMKHTFPEVKQYNIIARSSVALAAAVLCGFPYKCIIQICKSSSVMMIGVEQGISFH